MRDHYRVLKIRHTATPEEIHRSYRDLARRYHPDRNPAPDAAAEMTRINEAYAWLGDPARRAAYDRQFVAAEPAELRTAVLDAARELLRSRCERWYDTGGQDGIAESDRGRVAVRFLGLLGATELDDWMQSADSLVARGLAERAVCVAYRVFVRDELEHAVRPRGRKWTAIDLVESRSFGGELSGTAAGLFEPLLRG